MCVWGSSSSPKNRVGGNVYEGKKGVIKEERKGGSKEGRREGRKEGRNEGGSKEGRKEQEK